MNPQASAEYYKISTREKGTNNNWIIVNNRNTQKAAEILKEQIEMSGNWEAKIEHKKFKGTYS